ncbi:12815_t:CDS:2, partial [Dentiscutata heterogama]
DKSKDINLLKTLASIAEINDCDLFDADTDSKFAIKEVVVLISKVVAWDIARIVAK